MRYLLAAHLPQFCSFGCGFVVADVYFFVFLLAVGGRSAALSWLCRGAWRDACFGAVLFIQFSRFMNRDAFR
jgi:hypothetical protein